MKSNVLGYPRIGAKRELKYASEKYWKKTINKQELLATAATIRKTNWMAQQAAGIDFIPSNDFSLYDQVLDTSLTFGCIPKRFEKIKSQKGELDLYYAMARGYQQDGLDVKAMEMTKWFDTNYHYIVPEFRKDQQFEIYSNKIIDEYKEALQLGVQTKPVLLSPVTFLLLGKEKETGFHRIELLDNLLPVYFQLLSRLESLGVTYIQIDEPALALDLTATEQMAISKVYNEFNTRFSKLKIILTSYFDCFGENLKTALSLPVDAIHLDLIRCPSQLNDILEHPELNMDTTLSLGVVDGRNVWKNDFSASNALIDKAIKALGKDKVWIASSCSLLHCPYDLELETKQDKDWKAIKTWLAFAKQKLEEINNLKTFHNDSTGHQIQDVMRSNQSDNEKRKVADLIHNPIVKARISALTPSDSQRKSEFPIRQARQKQALNLPLFPTTTIGSFPQTKTVRQWRAKFRKKQVTEASYDTFIKNETAATIRFQEEIGLDVLVHGEYERNDMVEYFGEKLDGFTFTNFGWVQSYGSRCVKPPIIYGDVSRPAPMTVKWSTYAQSLTSKPVKGMLTGPVTILQWSFARNDQPRATTCRQIALAIRDEVKDLEGAGIGVIQIDEPALREGLPLRKEEREAYLEWAVETFRIAASGVDDQTQIHTHMCYSEFNDIINSIARMDADVITIETSRSAMELLEAFVYFKYPNEIGPGVYDIHSPRVPTEEEMEQLLIKASELIPSEHIWVNPDCGLKTRDWPETRTSLVNMVNTAKHMRDRVLQQY